MKKSKSIVYESILPTITVFVFFLSFFIGLKFIGFLEKIQQLFLYDNSTLIVLGGPSQYDVGLFLFFLVPFTLCYSYYRMLIKEDKKNVYKYIVITLIISTIYIFSYTKITTEKIEMRDLSQFFLKTSINFNNIERMEIYSFYGKLRRSNRSRNYQTMYDIILKDGQRIELSRLNINSHDPDKSKLRKLQSKLPTIYLD